MTQRRARADELAAVLPGLARLVRYDRSWLRGDLLAGVTVTAYLVPQVMAYAQLAGLPAETGLWAAMVSLVVYALLGSSRLLSVGPESTTALMTATTIAPLAAGEPGRYAELAAMLAVIVGLLCMVARLARLGFLADLLSKPVLVGYLAGVAVIMVVGQLGRLTAVDVHGESRPTYSGTSSGTGTRHPASYHRRRRRRRTTDVLDLCRRAAAGDQPFGLSRRNRRTRHVHLFT